MRRLALCLAVAALAATTARSAAADDPLSDRQWALGVVRAEAAWARTTGKGAVVAVLSAGVDAGHPDLKGVVTRSRALVGYSPATVDEDGSGTALAGVVAARRDNFRGISGVAPDARIVSVKITESAYTGFPASMAMGYLADEVSAGIDAAVALGAHVVLVGSGASVFEEALGPTAAVGAYDDGLHRSIAAASRQGVVVVVPAGDGPQPTCSRGAEAAGALCVVATDRRGDGAAYSRRDVLVSARTVAAPGGTGTDGYVRTFGGMLVSTLGRSDEDVLTLTSRQCTVCDSMHAHEEPGYAYWSGTAIAAAHVAGVAALLRAQGVKGAAAVRRIVATAVDKGPAGVDPLFGAGVVDADRATRGR